MFLILVFVDRAELSVIIISVISHLEGLISPVIRVVLPVMRVLSPTLEEAVVTHPLVLRGPRKTNLTLALVPDRTTK